MSGRDGTRGDDEIDVNLRSAVEIAFRVLALATVLRRVSLESDSSADAEAELFDLRQWCLEQGLASVLTPHEAALLSSPLGGVDEEYTTTTVWQAEGLERLLWAIGFSTSGPEAEQIGHVGAMQASPSPPEAAGKASKTTPFQSFGADAGLVINSLPGPWDPIAPWMKTARLRDEDEIAAERERAEIRHWLAGAELLWRDSGPVARDEIERTIREVLAEAVAAGLLGASAAERLGDAARPLASLSDNDLSSLAVATAERLRALNWVCGFGTDWDSTPLDV